jgi:hypothetical protein
MSLVVINNFNIFGVAIFETEHQPPRAVDRHRPLALPVTNQRVEANRFQRRDIIQRLGSVEHLHPRHGSGDIQPRELRVAIQRKAFRYAVGKAFDHLECVA